MNNKEVAAVLDEIAVLLELAGENPFKARSYTNAARTIEGMHEDVEDLVAAGKLRGVKGVGEALEKKIAELVKTGSLGYLDELRAQFPESLFELFRIPGLGPKRIKTLYKELGIASLGELEYACKENRLAALKGFGQKTQDNVLDGIAFARKHSGRHYIDEALEAAESLRALLEACPETQCVAIAGSLRRRNETVKDIDLLAAASDSGPVMACFVNAEAVAHVTGHGATKSSVVLHGGLAADLRVVSPEAFPYALHHFTGSKAHNVVMRQRAKERGLKLNEYGLFRGEENLPCDDEAAIFEALELPYIPPELREDRGEFDADPLPRLVEQEDLRGVFHCHTRYSDGIASIEQMAQAARDRGYAYLLISDHSQSAGYAGGLKPDAVARQHAEIDALNERLDGFRILKGVESDIRPDGALDYDDNVLASFDLVIASVHSKLNMDEAEATGRLVAAVENPYTHILGHPTGRLLLSREGYPVDIERVLDACAAHGVAVEINANCHRLDLDWRHGKRAKEKGVKLCISPDAHRPEGLDDVRYGLGIARKAWQEPGDLLNGMEVEALLAWRRSS